MPIKAHIFRHLCGRTEVFFAPPDVALNPMCMEECKSPKRECDPHGLLPGAKATLCMATKTQELSATEIAQIIQAELRRREGMKGIEPGVMAITTFGGEKHGS